MMPTQLASGRWATSEIADRLEADVGREHDEGRGDELLGAALGGR